MPPIRKFQKTDIINTAYEIVKNEGTESINARRIAKELNCSIPPIFHNFTTMEELKKAVSEKIYETYKDYMMKNISPSQSYKSMGLSYIKFAKEYPNFFKILFMQQTNLNTKTFIVNDSIGEATIENGQKYTGLSSEEQKDFHVKVFIFTHGLATLVATKAVEISEEEISNLLGDTVAEMLKGYKIYYTRRNNNEKRNRGSKPNKRIQKLKSC